MYMSRVALDLGNRNTMQALASPNLFHGAIERGFTGERHRRLWRIDRLGDNCYLLLVSQDKPEMQHIAVQFGFPDRADSSQSKDYAPLLDRLAEGQRWQFRLKANPTHSNAKDADEGASRGRLYAHVTQEQQKQWLLARQKSHGFDLKLEDFDVVHTQWLHFRKGGSQMVTVRTATFEGVLTVRDAELLRKSLAEGIGRAKAYGCGLLTIVQPKPPDHG